MKKHDAKDEQREATESELARLATGQKTLIVAIVVNLIGTRLAVGSPIVAMLVAVAVIGLLWIALRDVGAGLLWSNGTVVFYGVLMFIPVVNLIALLVVNSKVTSVLRKGGYTVGLFGAKKSHD